MTVYLAPLEGVTDAVFRRVHRDCFSGVAKYFIPFVSPTQNLAFTARDLSILAPACPNSSARMRRSSSGRRRRSATWAMAR